MQECVSEARQEFFLNLCRPYLTYSSSVPGILLQLILDCFRRLMQKKTFLVGGSHVSLNYAEFLVPVSLGLSVLCFASIALRCYADVFQSISLLLLISIIFSQPDFNKKISTAPCGHLLRSARDFVL